MDRLKLPELKDNTETERDKFLHAIKNAFGNYLQNKVSDWNKQEGEPIVKDALLRLANSTTIPYYEETKEKITQILLKDSQGDVNLVASNNSANVSGNMHVSRLRPGNVSDVPGIGGGIGGGLIGAVGGTSIGTVVSIGLSALLPHIATSLLLTGFLAPVGILTLLGAIWGAKEARKDHYMSEVKRQLKEQIPNIAAEKANSIYSNVRNSFSGIFKIVQSMDNDIKSQKEQLNNLLEQKKKNLVNIESEKERLANLGNTVANLVQEIVKFYDRF